MDIQNHDNEYGIDLIMDHLTGSSSDDLRKKLDEWQNASYENEEMLVWMQKMWHSLCLSDRDETFNKQRAYYLFRERINAETGSRVKRIPLRPYLLLRHIASYAAVLVSLLFLGYFTYRYFTIVAVQVEELPLLSEISVPNGSKTQLSLQDGSKVWLNSGSYLQYDSEHGRTNRSLTLSGEAYFEVAKDEHSPFIVNVGEIKIKVHGTHFNVNAYEENNGISVALIEGSVEIITSNGNIMLRPGIITRYDTATGKIEVMTNTTDGVLAWMDNRLIFNGETFEQIVCTLERRYDVKVNIHNNQIKQRRFAGDFINNETIEQIFSVMSVNGKFRYQIKGNLIDIY